MNRLEVLDISHDRGGFDCGSSPLNHYIAQVARQHAEKGISRVFVLVDEAAQAPKPLLGFFSLAACEAESESLPEMMARKMPRKIPAVRLGRLAVHKDQQGHGLGKCLVLLAMKKAAEAAAVVGLAGLFVDAKDENVARFYSRFGFVALPGSAFNIVPADPNAGPDRRVGQIKPVRNGPVARSTRSVRGYLDTAFGWAQASTV